MIGEKMGSRKSNGQKKIISTVSTYKSSDAELLMECSSEPLNEAQIEVNKKIGDEYNQFMKKLNETITKRGGEIIEQGAYVTVYEIDCSPSFPPPLVPQEISAVATASAGLIKSGTTSTLLTTTQANMSSLIPNSGVLLQGGTVASSGSTVFAGQPTTYQLVMGPRMGLIVTPSTPAPSSTIQSATNVNAPVAGLTPTRPTTTPRVQVRPGLGSVIPQGKRFVSSPAPKISVNPATQKNTPPMTKVTTAAPIPAPVSVPPPPLISTPSINTRSKMKLATRTSEPNISEPPPLKSNSNTGAVVDLTEEDGKQVADSREVSFNRYPGRIYPSLVVVARPNLKVKDMTSAMITAERTQLDTKVKGILTNSPTKFTEWLIQQGLVRSEQVCSMHVNVDMTPIKLKLGMYSDVSKFPYSGGYVWISDCCPQKFVSVFCNSIFEGAPHAPTVLLKLMYHWACQTNVHNIISWVKVDNLYIKNFFTNLRAVCTAAICEKFGKLGGPSKKIEVGVISLGTTSQNGSVRQVKVEVLGVMDPVTKFVRLRAVEPVQNAEKNHKLRFSRILESLEQWVDKRTTIITDYTVDKGTLNELGFNSVIQVQLNSSITKDNNQAVMEYLKRVVPRMFQNTLSLLSRSIIQQFLDELVWRERWGPISSRAFDNLILHLSELTKLETGDTLMNRLKSITANPFKDWAYKHWKNNCTLVTVPRKVTVGESADDVHPTGNKTTSKNTNMALRSKPGVINLVKTSKGVLKSSVPSLTTEDTLNNGGLIVPSIDNLPPSITEIDDDNVSVSSNSSRRSRTKTSTNEESRSNSTNARGWDPQLILKSLEGFYYGTLPPDVVVINKLRRVDLNMKCFTCGHTYNNNVLFMKHLAGHAQNEGAFTTDYQCRYCFRNFTTAFDLENHLGIVHFPNKFNSMCLICGERFKHRGALVTHMQITHVELELPYQCTICKFRASEHTKLIDHFYEVHDGGEKVQCPYCLRTVAFEGSNKVKLTQNVNFYFNHIKKHQKKPIKKCPKCVLTFVNKTLLKEHLTKDHNSCLNIPGIIRYQGSDFGTVLMPLPSVAPPLTRKGKPQQPLPVPNFSTYKLDNVLIYPELPPSKCIECKTEVNVNHHFTSYMTCMKCMFATCCKVVMTRHMDKLHESKSKRKLPTKRKIYLEKPLHCVCGFLTQDGNAMASHLIHCKRKIAYPSPERAAQYSVQMQSANFPALINLDDVEQDPDEASDTWLRAFVKPPENEEVKVKKSTISEKSPPRMLKVLGLVCKESSGDGENSEKEKNDVGVAKRTRSFRSTLEEKEKIVSSGSEKPLKGIDDEPILKKKRKLESSDDEKLPQSNDIEANNKAVEKKRKLESSDSQKLSKSNDTEADNKAVEEKNDKSSDSEKSSKSNDTEADNKAVEEKNDKSPDTEKLSKSNDIEADNKAVKEKYDESSDTEKSPPSIDVEDTDFDAEKKTKINSSNEGSSSEKIVIEAEKKKKRIAPSEGDEQSESIVIDDDDDDDDDEGIAEKKRKTKSFVDNKLKENTEINGDETENEEKSSQNNQEDKKKENVESLPKNQCDELSNVAKESNGNVTKESIEMETSNGEIKEIIATEKVEENEDEKSKLEISAKSKSNLKSLENEKLEKVTDQENCLKETSEIDDSVMTTTQEVMNID